MSRYPWKTPGFDSNALIEAAKKKREEAASIPPQYKKPDWLMHGFDAHKAVSDYMQKVRKHHERCMRARHIVWQ